MSNHYEDTIWKQITTALSSKFQDFELWAIITKIQSESKSQLTFMKRFLVPGCEQSLRRYNLKANHNYIRLNKCISRVVSNHYEDTIWKQITTNSQTARTLIQLWAIITKIQSESKSQLRLCYLCWLFGCEQSLRRYNLKANHNRSSAFMPDVMLWAIITKIQSESKSQPTDRYIPKPSVVSNHYEDTIWKQITTIKQVSFSLLRLWAIITKIQSESKSQPQTTTPNQL